MLADLLADERFEIAFVVTNPDKKFGRKQELIASPVKILTEKNNIAIFQPEKIRNNTEFLEAIDGYKCDYFVVVAYGKILPKILLDMPKNMPINVHGSILPKYRGASPIQSALLEGETETGVTIMHMSEGMDEGDMILMEKIAISEDETSATLFEKFGKISGAALIDGIIGLENGELSRIPQKNEDATYCKKIEKEDGKIDFSETAKKIYQKYQAYTPWPGIFAYYNDKRVLFETISYSSEKTEFAPGKIYKNSDGKIAIACGEGCIFPEILKMEGKKSQNIADFVNGNKEFLGGEFV